MAKWSNLTDAQVKEYIANRENLIKQLQAKKNEAILNNASANNINISPSDFYADNEVTKPYDEQIANVKAEIDAINQAATDKNINKYTGGNPVEYDVANNKVTTLYGAKQQLQAALNLLYKTDPSSFYQDPNVPGKYIVKPEFKAANKKNKQILDAINTVEQFSVGGKERKKIEKRLPKTVKEGSLVTAEKQQADIAAGNINGLTEQAKQYYVAGCTDLMADRADNAMTNLTRFNDTMQKIKEQSVITKNPDLYKNAKVKVFKYALANAHGVLTPDTVNKLNTYITNNTVKRADQITGDNWVSDFFFSFTNLFNNKRQ